MTPISENFAENPTCTGIHLLTSYKDNVTIQAQLNSEIGARFRVADLSAQTVERQRKDLLNDYTLCLDGSLVEVFLYLGKESKGNV